MSTPTAQEMLASLYQDGQGMKDHELADALGVSQPTVTRIRNGINGASLATHTALSELYLAKQAEIAARTQPGGGHAA